MRCAEDVDEVYAIWRRCVMPAPARPDGAGAGARRHRRADALPRGRGPMWRLRRQALPLVAAPGAGATAIARTALPAASGPRPDDGAQARTAPPVPSAERLRVNGNTAAPHPPAGAG